MSHEQDRAKERIAAELDRSRRRSNGLTLDSLDDEDLLTQHSPLMSPLVWDLAHIGNYEEQWLLRAAGGREALRPDIDGLYDAFENPRADRVALPLLRPDEARAYNDRVRREVLDTLESVNLETAPAPRNAGERSLLEAGFVFHMVIQHEHMHDETMLATHQLRRGAPVLLEEEPGFALSSPPPAEEVLVPAGPFTMGTDDDPWSYDNERSAHTVDLDAYWIDTDPVTNAAYLRFVADGGYRDPRWWTEEGWEWCQRRDAEAPAFWSRDGDGWSRRRFGRVEEVPPDQPVQHVSFHEAQAYARWAGKRLPTEAEWEKAARFDPATGRSLRFPWGDAEPTGHHANLGQRTLGPHPVGSHPEGTSPLGVRQLIGDVWEWTSTTFHGYPGFSAFPYREYSEVFFDDGYKVLRGGSWATHPTAVRSTFRNWDHPIRRQIFSGFRCARDAGRD
ncbi:ergothioneine biosynthesis protein EgtB [Nocardiopsis sp. L17-MgMaSL7]|uniref:ergothioneine biosynthesis protein EgtB n=1 Tax=Nocardiopsis sp. L17-MgMaSL7 TaxID=1938893 RepID=UPI000D70BC20|nr:ergothioneine biosynthesis protein EgtB [Nocardiopsis sp. L17-MgMaSL7]PWV58006.1 iron(II)-dependent oxidoreductase [Nocardiopsis sp. L17-MgMaSL7]